MPTFRLERAVERFGKIRVANRGVLLGAFDADIGDGVMTTNPQRSTQDATARTVTR